MKGKHRVKRHGAALCLAPEPSTILLKSLCALSKSGPSRKKELEVSMQPQATTNCDHHSSTEASCLSHEAGSASFSKVGSLSLSLNPRGWSSPTVKHHPCFRATWKTRPQEGIVLFFRYNSNRPWHDMNEDFHETAACTALLFRSGFVEEDMMVVLMKIEIHPPGSLAPLGRGYWIRS